MTRGLWLCYFPLNCLYSSVFDIKQINRLHYVTIHVTFTIILYAQRCEMVNENLSVFVLCFFYTAISTMPVRPDNIISLVVLLFTTLFYFTSRALWLALYLLASNFTQVSITAGRVWNLARHCKTTYPGMDNLWSQCAGQYINHTPTNYLYYRN